MPDPLSVHQLLVEYLETPLGIDELAPCLSWQLSSDRRETIQASYRVRVATTNGILISGSADLWDSGERDSEASHHVVYQGRPLASRQECFWQVQVRDQRGRQALSPVSRWEMGLLGTQDWSAQWIGAANAKAEGSGEAAPLVRTSFEVGVGLRRARAYVTAAGLYELRCNGDRVGDARLTPGWTDYHHRIQYDVHDLSDHLRPGTNGIGAVLSSGWYGGTVATHNEIWGGAPLLFAQIELEYSDARRETIATGDAWVTARGPITSSDLVHGESFDSRRVLPGWSLGSYDDSEWSPALVFTGPRGRLVSRRSEPVRITEDLKPVSSRELDPGVHIFDLGQNMVGWVRLRVPDPSGSALQLRFAEALNADGRIYTDNLRSAKATDTYFPVKAQEVDWEPSFTYHGFRYVELQGCETPPPTETVVGRVVGSSAPLVGEFECSDPLLNSLHRNIVWSQRGNLIEVPTDCPQRDERLGWLADAQVFASTATFNMNLAPFYTKWLDDVADAQSSEGAFPDVAPRVPDVLSDGAPGWGDGGVIVPWTVFRRYGDTRILSRHFDAMKSWIEFVHQANPDLVWRERRGHDFGDWLNVESDTPRDLIATAYFAYSTRLVSRAASAIGRAADARRYSSLADAIADAFVREFVSPDGRIPADTQTAYSLALRFELLPKHLREAAASQLADDVEARGHLTTGFLGVGQLLPALTDAGYLDLAYRLIRSESYPSWGYQIRHGATTIWERWDGWTEDMGFQDSAMNSFNHYSLGSVGEWLYEVVGGIRLHPDIPGFKKVVIAPRPGGGVDWSQARYRSPYGLVRCEWRRTNQLEVDVEIPSNSSASVLLPSKAQDHVTEGGCAVAESEGVRSVTSEGDSLSIEIGSGSYHFVCRDDTA